MTLMAQDWQTPIIEGYGKMVANDSAVMQPNPEKEYKIIFHIKSDAEREGVNEGLYKVARLINLLGNGGVPAENLKIVAVVSGKAVSLVVTDKIHQERFKKSNPNLGLLQKLTDYGVNVLVCSQTLAQHHLDENTHLNPYIKVTLSALTAVTGYQMEGYVPMF